MGDNNSSREASWPSVFWSIAPMALSAMAQPGGRVLSSDARYRTYLRASPFICAFDAFAILLRVSIYCLQGNTWSRAVQRVMDARLEKSATPSPDESSSTGGACAKCRGSKYPGFQGLEDLTFVRWLIFLFGALPQYIKLMAMEGVTRSQVWCNMYLVEIVVLEIVISTRDWASPWPILVSPRKRKEDATVDEEQGLTDPNPTGTSTSVSEDLTQTQDASASHGTDVEPDQPVPNVLAPDKTDGFTIMDWVFWTLAMLSQFFLLSRILNALDDTLRRRPGRYEDLRSHDSGGLSFFCAFFSMAQIIAPPVVGCIISVFILVGIFLCLPRALQNKIRADINTAAMIGAAVLGCVFFVILHYSLWTVIDICYGGAVALGFSEWAVDFAILAGGFGGFVLATYFAMCKSPWLRLKILHLGSKKDAESEREIKWGSFIWTMFVFSVIFPLLYYILSFDSTGTVRPKWTDVLG